MKLITYLAQGAKLKPVGDEVADITKWRNKLRPGRES